MPRPIVMAVLVIVAPPAWSQEVEVPVTVGGSASAAACAAKGRIAHAEIAEEELTPVRVAPAAGSPAPYELGLGDEVFLCERRDGWWGVVFGAADCGVSKPIASAGAYGGRCGQGWIDERMIEVLAR